MNICESCGADPFKTVDYDKKTQEMNELSRRYRGLSASYGQARAEWEIKEIGLTESMKWLQRKTKKQAQAIQRLEAKLKKLGEQPYKEEFTVRLNNGKLITQESHEPL